MINAKQIKPNTPVVGSNNRRFAVVDHVAGARTIKLKKDAEGHHHYIPLGWVESVDDAIHLDRSADDAMKEWYASPIAMKSA